MSKKESINNRLNQYNEMYRDMNVSGISVQQDFIQTHQQNKFNLQKSDIGIFLRGSRKNKCEEENKK